MRPAFVLALLMVLCAACPTRQSGPTVAQVSTQSSAATRGGTGVLAFASCMRTHGVSNFPDPGGQLPAGIDTLAPGYQAAQRACQTLLPQGTGGGTSAAQQEAGLQYAACMRSHGVPNFPDPIVGHGFQFDLPPGMDPNSSQFQAAHSACASWTPDRGRGPQGRLRETP